MPLADVQILCAVQSPVATDADRDAFERHYRQFFHFVAARQCRNHHLDLSLVGDIIASAMAMVLDASLVRFDPARSDDALEYVKRMVMNAAKQQSRFSNRGVTVRHDFGDPDNGRRHAPASVAEIEGRADEPTSEDKDLVAKALLLADAVELVLIQRHFFGHESIEDIAVSMGVARTTISRRLQRFYERAAAQLAA